MFCREQVTQLRDAIRQWQEQGHRVVIIGNGNAHFAEAFRRELELTVPVLIDEERSAYEAAELRRGVASMLSPRLVTNAFRAFKRGARQKSTQGDPWQLGGAFVIGAGGELRMAFRAGTAGDHVAADAIEAALREEDCPASSPPSSLASLVDSVRPVLDVSPVMSFDRIGFRRHALGFDPWALEVDMRQRRCVVTGANSGIGFATARALAALGAEVVVVCRNQQRGEAAARAIRDATGNPAVSLEILDISDLDAIDLVARRIATRPVDVLVHNAGLMVDERQPTPQGLELTFATHVAGPHRLMHGLRGALCAAPNARVIWVSSGGMLTRRLNVDDPQWSRRPFDGVVAYAETKRAQVVLAELWADELAGAGVSVNAMHPGWVDTPAVKRSLPRFYKVTEAILRTPEEGADTVIWLAASRAAARHSGAFFFDRKPVKTHWLPSTRETRREQLRLWKLCEQLVQTPHEADAARGLHRVV